MPEQRSHGRKRGPLVSLFAWWRCAVRAWPRAHFVGKADDDVYVHLAGVAAHLRASLDAVPLRNPNPNPDPNPNPNPHHNPNPSQAASRELLMSVVATRPAGGGAQPQRVTIGSDGGLDPLKAAVWRMGRAPREPLLKATEVLPAPVPPPHPSPYPYPYLYPHPYPYLYPHPYPYPS